jgi:hypothetical protein
MCGTVPVAIMLSVLHLAELHAVRAGWVLSCVSLTAVGCWAWWPACRQRLHSHRGLWQPACLLRTNLEAVLGIELPQRPQQCGGGGEEASADCAICYAYRLPAADGGTASGE